MSARKQKRKAIPKATEAEVLLQCKRRCCVCVGLNGDLSVKSLQIAHLDGNRNNNRSDNLAPLCFDHHNEYDSIPSQSKKLTPAEIKAYRASLNAICKKKDQGVT